MFFPSQFLLNTGSLSPSSLSQIHNHDSVLQNHQIPKAVCLVDGMNDEAQSHKFADTSFVETESVEMSVIKLTHRMSVNSSL